MSDNPKKSPLKILTYPDNFLRSKTRKVKDFDDPQIAKLVFDMVKTMDPLPIFVNVLMTSLKTIMLMTPPTKNAIGNPKYGLMCKNFEKVQLT